MTAPTERNEVDRFAQELAALDEHLRSPGDEHTSSDDVSSRVSPAYSLLKLLHEAFPRQTASHEAPVSIGRFEITKLLGEGTFGRVYCARDPLVGREVALKVAKFEGHELDQRVARFLREAKAVAGLRHPHIVPLFEFGQDGSRLYIAFAYIAGRTLQQEIARRKVASTWDPRWSATLIARLAEALAYAHSSGIVHRDVKPANVLIDGNDSPCLTDFGLAHDRSGSEQLTATGQILGTPLYMAPEQALNRGDEIGGASDQYSLGVILFELLTGRTPFHGSPRLVMHHHLETDCPSPRKFEPRTPRDLETICHKCLEKRPEKRYRDCQELADDLHRWLSDEPIQARRIGVTARVWRWSKRNPSAAAMAGAILATTLLGIGAVGQQWNRAVVAEGQERQRAADLEQKTGELTVALTRAIDAEAMERDRATETQKALEIAERSRANAQMALAQMSFEKEGVRSAEAQLERVPKNLRFWDWHALSARFNGADRTFTGLEINRPLRVGWSNDGRRVFGADVQKLISWDVSTGRQIASWSSQDGPNRHLYGFAVHPFKDELVVAAGEKIVRMDPANLTPLGAFGGPVGPVYQMEYSADGRLLTTLDGDRKIRVWDAETGTLRREFNHRAPFRCFTLSDDGRTMASADVERTLSVWNLEDGELSLETSHLEDDTSVLRISTRDNTIAANLGPKLAVWDIVTGKPIADFLRHTDTIQGMAFAKKNDCLATASADHTIRLWKGRSIVPGIELKGHAHRVYDLVFDSTGTYLLSGSEDGTVRIWDIGRLESGTTFVEVEGRSAQAVQDPQGKSLVVISNFTKNPYVQYHRLDGDREVRYLKGLDTGASSVSSSVSIHPDGSAAAGGGQDGAICFWDLPRGECLTRIQTQIRHCRVVFSPTGSCMVAGGEHPDIEVRDARNGELLGRLAGHSKKIVALAWSHDSSALASASIDGSIRLWDMTNPAAASQVTSRLIEPPGIDKFTALAFHPREPKLLSGSSEGALKLWNVLTGTTLKSESLPDRYLTAVAFTPDGERLVSGDVRGVVQFHDIVTLQMTFELRSEIASVRWLDFSRATQRLAVTRLGPRIAIHPPLPEKIPRP